MRTAMKYGAGLIALYLGVFYWTGSGTLITDSQAGLVNTIRAFQGR